MYLASVVNLGIIWCFGFFFLESLDDLWWGVQQRDHVLASRCSETGQHSDTVCYYCSENAVCAMSCVLKNNGKVLIILKFTKPLSIRSSVCCRIRPLLRATCLPAESICASWATHDTLVGCSCQMVHTRWMSLAILVFAPLFQWSVYYVILILCYTYFTHLYAEPSVVRKMSCKKYYICFKDSATIVGQKQYTKICQAKR